MSPGLASPTAATAARALETLKEPASGTPPANARSPGPSTRKSERLGEASTSSTPQVADEPLVEKVATGSSVSAARRRPCSSSTLTRARRARSGVNSEALAA